MGRPRGSESHRELAATLNGIRPYASVGYSSPAPEAFVAVLAAWLVRLELAPQPPSKQHSTSITD